MSLTASLQIPTSDTQKLGQLLQGMRTLKRKSDIANARTDLLTYLKVMQENFQTPAHVKLIVEKLEAVERGEITRLCISMPPRHGKSFTASESFPAWFLGRNPKKYVIAATYAQELAEDFGRKVRNQIMDPTFSEIFPDVAVSPDSQSIKRFHTTQDGVYFAVGAGSAITGRGAHVLLIDDPIKGDKEADSEIERKNLIEWYKSVAYSRMMPGNSAIVIIATRWHEDDLIGWVTRETAHEGWEILNLPAIANDNDPLGRAEGEALWDDPVYGYPLNRLLKIKGTAGKRVWSSLYQQSPVADDGNIFKRADFQIWEEPQPPNVAYILQSYDTAYEDSKRADPSAIQTWGIFYKDGFANAILLTAMAATLEFPELLTKAKKLYKDQRPDSVIIESKASGASLIQTLRQAGIPVIKYVPDRDKVARAWSVSALFEAGLIWVPKEKAWAESLVNQAMAFPNGKNDDQVDAMTQALIRLKEIGMLVMPDRVELEDEDEREERPKKFYWGR